MYVKTTGTILTMKKGNISKLKSFIHKYSNGYLGSTNILVIINDGIGTKYLGVGFFNTVRLVDNVDLSKYNILHIKSAKLKKYGKNIKYDHFIGIKYENDGAEISDYGRKRFIIDILSHLYVKVDSIDIWKLFSISDDL